MAFINRKISEQDRSFYQLELAESSRPKGALHPNRYCVIDDHRQIYLREVWRSGNGPDPIPHPSEILCGYHFFINNTTYLVQMKNDLKSKTMKEIGKALDITEVWIIVAIDPRDDFSRSALFLDVLREAMLASNGGAPFAVLLSKENGVPISYKLTISILAGK